MKVAAVPYQAVPEHVVHAAVRDGAVAVIEAGDSLFGFKGNSQTWLVEEATDGVHR
ncbi:hypothetical protein [Mesorhizobium sp. WSM3862]|uniref:hypothetical protein n=1 Tax=Mesorhizobium sp. WSM3862 TaxID=632858 RepID=UPI001596C901|nr:hypothetical protein [Mesorhizobium sp. WSM3862]